MKTKKSSCIFSNIYLSFPHNIRAYTSDRIPTLSVCLLIDTQGGGEFWSWIAFFFFSFMSLHVDFQIGQCCWRAHASFSVAGVLLAVTIESGLRVIRSSSAWTSVKPGFCPWKKREQEKKNRVISCSFCVVYKNNRLVMWELVRWMWMSAACWYAFKSSMLCGYTNANLLRKTWKRKERK